MIRHERKENLHLRIRKAQEKVSNFVNVHERKVRQKCPTHMVRSEFWLPQLTLFLLLLRALRPPLRLVAGPRLLPSPSWFLRPFWHGFRHASGVFRRGPARCRGVR